VCGPATESEEPRRIGCGAVVMRRLYSGASRSAAHTEPSLGWGGLPTHLPRRGSKRRSLRVRLRNSTAQPGPGRHSRSRGLHRLGQLFRRSECHVPAPSDARDEFDAEAAIIGRSETCITSNLLVAGLVVEALVHYLAVFPSARRDLLHLDSTPAALEGDVVLPL